MLTNSKTEFRTAGATPRSPTKLSRGVLFILVGSSSYGMLSTFVKLAYKQNFTTAEITTSQYFWGLICLFCLNLFEKKNHTKESLKDVILLAASGTFGGFTSFFYYACVKYIDASIAVVLLMQSVWIGVVIEALQKRKIPELNKIVSVALILVGTLLATNLVRNEKVSFDLLGLSLGFLAAVSFSLTLYSSHSVAPHLAPVKRSLYMLIGGGVVVFGFCIFSQLIPHAFGFSLFNDNFTSVKKFDLSIFTSWGILVSLFGTVIPPIMLNKGFPIVGVGLGSILASMELPFAITIAFTFLDEKIALVQWVGVAVILSAIVLMNYKLLLRNSRN